MAKVFISYRDSGDELRRRLVNELYDHLQRRGHAPFLDKRELHGGSHWSKEIFERIEESDALVVLVTKDGASRWVQREVDYARACRVGIVPVVMLTTDLVMDPETGSDPAAEMMNALEMHGIHYEKALTSVDNPESRFADVVSAIETMVTRTRQDQKAWVDRLTGKIWKDKDASNLLLQPPKPTVARRATYAYFLTDIKPHSTTIYLGGGDITEVSQIDVLVNSENTYMQMQRIFERASVSKSVRWKGAQGISVNDAYLIQRDLVQEELYREIFDNGKFTPVGLGTVIVTSAGDVQGKLVQQGFKYVFHVAAVPAHPVRGEEKLDPSQAEKIGECVLNCLARFDALAREEGRPPIRSIVFPILGTGNAGLDLDIATVEIINAIKQYLSSTDATRLEAITLMPFREGEIRKVANLMDLHLRRVNHP
ncbi:MAG: TIR domain-containing protein [Chloroflexi bacterium]|nr:TIR domain-containing protein [Chloroflexota bacterium]